MKNFISYEGLPLKSGGAHKINKNPIVIFESVIDFIKSFTNNDAPYDSTLIFNTSENKDSKSATFWLLFKAFGLPGLSLTNKQFSWIWKVRNSQLSKAVSFSDRFTNLTLAVMWRFRFVDPVSKKIIIGQDKIPVIDERLYNSQIYLRIGKVSTISIWFTFPFTSTDNLNYLKLVKDNCPFALSKNQWKSWKLSKNGNWIDRKINIDEITFNE
ncbi:hypothetical protein [Mucilaginibacter lappiensis]|uniref:hypothetical protein n=1 Tax=Mucilaginibacter lappiensis TaxID=354630 RepID=UPI003D207620